MEKWDFFDHKIRSGKILLPSGNENLPCGNGKIPCGKILLKQEGGEIKREDEMKRFWSRKIRREDNVVREMWEMMRRMWEMVRRKRKIINGKGEMEGREEGKISINKMKILQKLNRLCFFIVYLIKLTKINKNEQK